MQEALAHRSIMLVHPTGGASVHQALTAIGQAGAHADFYTTIAWRAGSILDRLAERLAPQALRKEFARRSYPELPPQQIHTHVFREMIRTLAQRKGWTRLIEHETGPFRLDAVCAALDRATAHTVKRRFAWGRRLDAVYAYDDCALETFRAAHKQGTPCFYDLPIGYTRKWRETRDREMELEPLWGQTIASGAFTEERLVRKDLEIGAADRVIVPSQFVADSLTGSPARNITIVPYGCPLVTSAPPRERRAAGPLRVLWVGIISQRKGISYLLKAMEQLKGVAELTLIGQFGGQFASDAPELLAQLNRHRWIRTMPHADVLETMRNHDVFVLPTLWEGRALVVLEALSQGLPVITTPNAGTADVVLDGVSGFVVPIRSPDAIAQNITRLAEDRSLLESMSEQAMRLAGEATWELYRARWITAIAEGLENR